MLLRRVLTLGGGDANAVRRRFLVAAAARPGGNAALARGAVELIARAAISLVGGFLGTAHGGHHDKGDDGEKDGAQHFSTAVAGSYTHVVDNAHDWPNDIGTK